MFNYYQPTKIEFGIGKANHIGEITSQFGKDVLLVTTPEDEVFRPLYTRIKNSLTDSGLNVIHFDGVKPNPTTDVIAAGVAAVGDNKVDVVIGLGGGSSMDTAKAIAVELTHEGNAWDYLFYKKQPTEKTLPIITVTTTAGTGSQVTQVAVITNTANKDKSAIFNDNIYPKVAVVDPELTLTLPPKMTAFTGFDAFCHNFEAYISVKTNPIVEAMALYAIELVANNLENAVKDGSNINARNAMSVADTLGGLSIASSSVTLPHGLGMQIGGHCPHVAHGEALALIYPEFMKYTYKTSIQKFARVARIFNKDLLEVGDEIAAQELCNEVNNLLKRISLWYGFKDVNISKQDIREIADAGQVLGDYENNPRIATIEEMYEMMMNGYERN